MTKYITYFVAIMLIVGLSAGVAAKDNDKPIKFKQLKKMIEQGEATEVIVAEIEERGLDFEMDTKTKGKLSVAGADPDLMLYFNDPYKYKAKAEGANKPDTGNLTINIDGSWMYSDESEEPFEMAVFIDGEKIKSLHSWTRILQVGAMGGGSLYNADYVTKMTLEPGVFNIPQIETGTREIGIAMVIGDNNPSDSKLRGNIIYSRSVNIEASQNTMLDLEAYNDSKGGFKLR
jgi:hypothetical protein